MPDFVCFNQPSLRTTNYDRHVCAHKHVLQIILAVDLDHQQRMKVFSRIRFVFFL